MITYDLNWLKLKRYDKKFIATAASLSAILLSGLTTNFDLLVTPPRLKKDRSTSDGGYGRIPSE